MKVQLKCVHFLLTSPFYLVQTHLMLPGLHSLKRFATEQRAKEGRG